MDDFRVGKVHRKPRSVQDLKSYVKIIQRNLKTFSLGKFETI